MILHVVGDEEFNPEPARIVEYPDFFIERIRDTDIAAVFEFRPTSSVKAQIERMARKDEGFEQGGQALAREFARLHPGSSRDGAFFIFELRTDNPDVIIYSLIKYDYQQVIEQQEVNGSNLLRLIIHAFVADKRAIQKSALIRVVNGSVETAIAAKDRMKQAPEIGDYFAKYLDVTRTRDDEQLNRKLIEAVSKALKDLQEILPNKNVPLAFREAKTALSSRQRITEQAIEESIIAAAGNPEDEITLTRIQSCVRRKIKSAKLEGLEFTPNRQLLSNPAIRRLRTTEGVLLFYPDREGNSNVARISTPDGGEIITITTRHIEEDGIVRREPRSAT